MKYDAVICYFVTLHVLYEVDAVIRSLVNEFQSKQTCECVLIRFKRLVMFFIFSAFIVI